MNFFSATNWKLIKSASVNRDDFSLAINFSGNPLLIKAITSQKNVLSNKAGLIYQGADIQGLGRVQLTDKISIDLDNLVLFCWRKMPSYQLFFERSSWIENLQIQIYQSIMPLSFEPSINIPSQVASSATSFTIPLSTTSVSLLAANTSRKKLVIANNSNQDLYIDLDATASVADHAIKIPKVSASGFIANYELENYTGVVSGIWGAAGAGAALVREMV